MLKYLTTGCVLFLLLITKHLAQSVEWEFEILPLPGGESGNSAEVIIQDKIGYMWIGSQNGLHRYDGKEFKTFQHNPTDKNSISDNYIEALYEDHEGYIWIGTSSQGLDRLDPITENFTHFPQIALDPSTQENHLIDAILEDSARNLWIGSLYGLYRFDKSRQNIRHYLLDLTDTNSLSFNRVTDLLIDNEHTLWVATGFYWFDQKSGGLNRYDAENDQFKRYLHNPKDPNSLGKNSIWDITEDSQGNFWIGTGGRDGLYAMDREKGTFTHYPFDPNQPKALSVPATKENYLRESVGIWKIFEDQDKRLWILSFDRGLSIYDPTQNTAIHYPSNPGSLYANRQIFPQKDQELVTITQCRDGSIWIGSGGHGALFIARPKEDFISYVDFSRLNIENEIIQELYEDRKGHIWVGMDRGKLIQFDSNLTQYKSFDNLSGHEDAPGSGQIRSMATDGLGNLWIGSNIGIDRLNVSQKSFTLFPLPTPTNPLPPLEQVIMSMHAYGPEDIWIGSYSWGLFRYNTLQNSFQNYAPNEGFGTSLKGRHIVNMFTDSKNRLWVLGGNISAGSFIPTLNTGFIDQWDANKEAFIHHLPKKDFAILGGSAVSMVEDSIGNLWFVAWDGGLHQYNPGTGDLKYFNPDNGKFPEWDTRWIVKDQDGLLWIGTLHHIYQFNPKNDEYEAYSLLGEYEGENRHGQALYSQQKEILFVWGNGIYRFDPEKYKLRKNDRPPEIVFADLYIEDEKIFPYANKILPEPLHQIDHLTLSYTQNTFSISIPNFHFDKSSLNRVEYKLEPYDVNWQKLGADQLAKYTQVLPGDYTLYAKGYNSEGIQSREKALKITILPPWWQSWWAYTLYGLGMLFLIIGIYNYQRRRWQLQTQLQLEQEKANRLKELDNFKSRFYTNITHEFRTPLTVIKGMASQIKEDQNIKTLIQRNSQRLLNMVNQLLDLSRLETNSLNIHWIQGDIIPYLQYLTESCHSLAESKKLNLAFFSTVETLVMDYDENKLQQILINLLSNAIKFTPEYGSIKVIANRQVEDKQAYLELVVRDTGRGIPQDKLSHIFNRFYQVDASSTRSGEGSGIGLALVKELVELLKGHITVSSEMDKGTEFNIYLPIRQMVSQTTQGPSVAEHKLSLKGMETSSLSTLPIANNADEKTLVLVIEDNADVSEYIFSCLKYDYTLQAARNGKEGVDKAFEIIPDVILCDVMMPEMDGFEVCERLKSDKLTSHIPIVLLTAKATQEDKVTGLSHGADAYLTKPFDKEELLARLKNLSLVSKRLQESLATANTTSEKPNPLAEKEAIFLNEVNTIIDSNIDNELFNTEWLCREIAMSRTQLHRKLKALTNQSTANYIRSIRLQKAKSLLETTDHPIGEIALMVGFKEFSHFSRMFLKEFGMQPSKVRVK